MNNKDKSSLDLMKLKKKLLMEKILLLLTHHSDETVNDRETSSAVLYIVLVHFLSISL